MDTTLITMKIILLTTALSLSAPLGAADQVVKENNLLKSWGLQLNTQGQLKFRVLNKNSLKYKPWNPDLSVYHSISSGQTEHETLEPLVISSKQKSEK